LKGRKSRGRDLRYQAEAALALGRLGTNKVTPSYRGDNFKRARERTQQFLEEAEKDGRLNVQRNSTVAEIRQDSVTLNGAGGNVDLPNDYVFALIGGESPEEFLRKTGIEIIEKVLAA